MECKICKKPIKDYKQDHFLPLKHKTCSWICFNTDKDRSKSITQLKNMVIDADNEKSDVIKVQKINTLFSTIIKDKNIQCVIFEHKKLFNVIKVKIDDIRGWFIKEKHNTQNIKQKLEPINIMSKYDMLIDDNEKLEILQHIKDINKLLDKRTENYQNIEILETLNQVESILGISNNK